MSKIVIENHEYDLQWLNNLTADDIQKMLPLDLNMQAYGAIEYFQELPITPYYDKKDSSRNAKLNTLVYCKEYHALVLVVKEHQDIFDEIPVATIMGDVSDFSRFHQNQISVILE